MNEVQQIVRQAIEAVKATDKATQQVKWRNKVIDRLEEVEALASKVPNMSHPVNQPLPELPPELRFDNSDDYDPDEPIDLSKIDLFRSNNEPND